MNVLLQRLLKRSPRIIVRAEDRLSAHKKLAKAFVWVLVFMIAHMAAMVAFESMSLFDALWLTLTTLTTVGYGDISAETVNGRLATIFLLYLPGIYLFTTFLSEYVWFSGYRKDQKTKGYWRWKMKDHIVILNTPEVRPEQYFERLVGEIRKSAKFKNTPVQILTSLFPDGLPEALKNLGVVHYTGRADDVGDLQAVDVDKASYIVVLSKRADDKFSDGQTFDVVHRLRDVGINGTMIVECVDDQNRSRLDAAGADILVRPVRAYPTMLVSAMVTPGSEKLIEDTFTQDGARYVRMDFQSSYRLPWKQVCFYALKEDMGNPVAYVDPDGRIVNCMGANDTISIKGLLLMSNSNQQQNATSFEAILNENELHQYKG